MNTFIHTSSHRLIEEKFVMKAPVGVSADQPLDPSPVGCPDCVLKTGKKLQIIPHSPQTVKLQGKRRAESKERQKNREGAKPKKAKVK